GTFLVAMRRRPDLAISNVTRRCSMRLSKLCFMSLPLLALLIGCGADDGSADTETVSELSSPVGACGKLGHACCANNTCKGGLNCNFNVQICTGSCGAAGQACCGVAQSCNAGLMCNWDHCASSCGLAGEECCRPENRCFNGSTCNTSTGFCQ